MLWFLGAINTKIYKCSLGTQVHIHPSLGQINFQVVKDHIYPTNSVNFLDGSKNHYSLPFMFSQSNNTLLLSLLSYFSQPTFNLGKPSFPIWPWTHGTLTCSFFFPDMKENISTVLFGVIVQKIFTSLSLALWVQFVPPPLDFNWLGDLLWPMGSSGHDIGRGLKCPCLSGLALLNSCYHPPWKWHVLGSKYWVQGKLTLRTDLNPSFNMELGLAGSSLDWQAQIEEQE